jgi:flagellar basal body rod protein FlgF
VKREGREVQRVENGLCEVQREGREVQREKNGLYEVQREEREVNGRKQRSSKRDYGDGLLMIHRV